MCGDAAAAAGPSFAVIDDFLEPKSFLEVLSQCPEMCAPLRKERAVQVEVSRRIVHQLRDFLVPRESTATRETDDVEMLLPSESPVLLHARVGTGDHHDHADVTLSGQPVTGRTCLVYIGGSGTFVLTDLWAKRRGKCVEHRVDVRPNRAIRWDNARYTHRVEVSENVALRLMLGPCSVDSGGELLCTMSPSGLEGLGQGLDQIMCFMFMMSICCCLCGISMAVVPPLMMGLCLSENEASACGGWIALFAVAYGCALCVLCAMNLNNWRSCLVSCSFSCFGPGRQAGQGANSPSVSVDHNGLGLTGRHRRALGDTILKGQNDFCTQCVLAGQELVRDGKVQRSDVEAIEPRLVLGLPAVVTFRFLRRSAAFGDRFVFQDGCVVMDRDLPQWHPLVYLFLQPVRQVRSSLGKLNLSDEEAQIVEMNFLGDEASVGLNAFSAGQATAVKQVISDVNSIAIDISRLDFYKARLAEIARSILHSEPPRVEAWVVGARCSESGGASVPEDH